ncbi:MAG TPA: DUF5063 domain-containing protein [Prolixibacteraceae bacterium]|nr:DUF5063 domain-containing protein [Prolixibacteraceae bacterium]
MSQDLEQIVYSKNVIEFVAVANEYCNFVENHAQVNRRVFVERMQKIFPLVYLKASLLPQIDDENAESPEKFVNEVEYNFLVNKLAEKLAQFDSYQEVFDERMQFSEGAIDASISENICDIYQDLKDFIMAYRIGTVEIMVNALWECNNNFQNYWGQKLVNGLRAIHTLVYGDNDIDQNDEAGFKTEEIKNGGRQSGWIDRHFSHFDEED